MSLDPDYMPMLGPNPITVKLINGDIAALTGTFYQDGAKRYVDRGFYHRDLGPAWDWGDGDNRGDFWIGGRPYAADEYWGLMALKYKGTQHEADCLAKALCSK